jgi:uncharacterized coiled-coil DUF342 family protein
MIGSKQENKRRSRQRDQALERGDSSLQRVHTLTQANNNADRMIGQLVQERNEAWNERNLLRQRVEELEEYNVNLHEEFHALYNGIGSYAPLEARRYGRRQRRGQAHSRAC